MAGTHEKNKMIKNPNERAGKWRIVKRYKN